MNEPTNRTESVARPTSGTPRELNAQRAAGLACGTASSGRRLLEQHGDARLVPSRITRDEAGFSHFALMVATMLFAAVLMVAIPEGAAQRADRQVSAVAEALTNGIRKTRAAAVAKGHTTLFALAIEAPPAENPKPVTYAPNWFAELNAWSSLGKASAAPELILASTEGMRQSVTIAGPAVTCFDVHGHQTGLAASGNRLATPCTVADPAIYQVFRGSGATRYFDVLVYADGRVRECDAAEVQSAEDPDGC
jgi:Tfp pilus assembly protein FimT